MEFPQCKGPIINYRGWLRNCTVYGPEGAGASVVLRLQKRGSEKALATLQGRGGGGHNKFWGNQRSQPCFTPPVVHV